MLAGEALRAVGLIADKLGVENGQFEIGSRIPSIELRKKIYAKFGVDLIGVSIVFMVFSCAR